MKDQGVKKEGEDQRHSENSVLHDSKECVERYFKR